MDVFVDQLVSDWYVVAGVLILAALLPVCGTDGSYLGYVDPCKGGFGELLMGATAATMTNSPGIRYSWP